MIFAATLLLLLAFAAAQDEPARCRHPDEVPESSAGEFEAAMMVCRDQDDECTGMQCFFDVLDLLDEDGTVKPEELVDMMLPKEGYEETREYMIETITDCIEKDEGASSEECGVLRPLLCAGKSFKQDCDW